MIGIVSLVEPPAIMEDGEQPHDLDVSAGPLRESQPVFENPGPVGDPVIATPREFVGLEDGVDELGIGVRHDDHSRTKTCLTLDSTRANLPLSPPTATKSPHNHVARSMMASSKAVLVAWKETGSASLLARGETRPASHW